MKRETEIDLNLIKQDLIKKIFQLPKKDRIEILGDLASWCIEFMTMAHKEETEK